MGYNPDSLLTQNDNLTTEKSTHCIVIDHFRVSINPGKPHRSIKDRFQDTISPGFQQF